jgi:hypothetical protein
MEDLHDANLHYEETQALILSLRKQNRKMKKRINICRAALCSMMQEFYEMAEEAYRVLPRRSRIGRRFRRFLRDINEIREGE